MVLFIYKNSGWQSTAHHPESCAAGRPPWTTATMEEELQRMREEMAELRAENQRLSSLTQRLSLSEQTADQVEVRTPPPGNVHTPSQRRETVYLPRERKCPKFSGASSAGLTVEEWVEEVESCLRVRHMSEYDKALFVYDHLEPPARTEIKFRSDSVKQDSKQIIEILKEIYGCSKSYVSLQQRFFDRKQKEGESLQDFSHALMTLMEKIQLRHTMSNPQVLLRDQFCENVRDHMLRRELKTMVRQNGEMTLLDIRRAAIRWVEEGQPSREKYVRPIPQSCEAQATATSEAVGVGKTDFEELKSMFAKQQAQLDWITQSLNSNMGAGRGRAFPRTNRYQRAPDGRPICLKCAQPGHISRYCTQNNPQNNPQSNTPAQANTVEAQLTQSENYSPPAF